MSIVHITLEQYIEFMDEQPTGQWTAPLKQVETQLSVAVTVAAKPQVNNSLSSFAAAAKQVGYRKQHWTEKLANELDNAKVDIKSTSMVIETGPGWAGRVAK